MVEIAQQVFNEKIKKISQQLENLNEFQALYQAKTDAIYERLKRIEGVIDRLQSAILEKVGSYGTGIESVKKELSMMQDTYAKLTNAVAEKREHHSAPEHSAPHHNAHVVHHAKSTAKKRSRKR